METTYDEQNNELLQLYIESNIDKEFFILSKKKNAFFIIDLQGKVAYANQLCEYKLGHSPEELVSMGLGDLFAANELDKSQTFFKDKVPETLSTFNTQISISTVESLSVKLTFFPIYNRGVYLGTFIILREPKTSNT